MKKISSYIFLAATALLMSSCQDYLNINEDPSNPQVAEGYALLPPIVAQMVRGEQFDGRYAGQYSQVWASSAANNTWDLHSYVSGSDAGGEKWRSHYWSIGTNIDLIVADGVAKQKWDYVGAAKAIRAWSWQSTTDWHCEMVLKQAFEPNRYVFDYDSQDLIYEEVRRLSQEALDNLNKTGDGVGSLVRGDKVYNGNVDKWKKFVYATLARNANHISNKSSYNPDKVIEYCDKAMSSNADNFMVPHRGASTADGNFFGPLRDNMQSFRQTDFSISLLDGRVFNGVVDPRLPLMFTACVDGVYRGVTPGSVDPNATPVDNPKRVPILWGVPPSALVGKSPVDVTKGKYIYKDDAPFPIITYSEIQFIKAEAAFRKGDKATALAAYKNAIGAHMDFVGVSASDKATFLASKAIKQTGAELTLSDIMCQKFIAMYAHGNMETWVDMRRYKYDSNIYTGFTLPRAFATENNGKPVQRVRPRYNSEYVWNRASLDKLGGNNPDYHTYEQWFTKTE
ncbi:MAG: SusD/RagB family nutrient-binding outer membrane lipoprotein [Flectobacillus sp.]|uniref:SusD/RagB family nutrient-binding outer membrane lipoprotein n=1 Tax=Flectobacillus sp. TaxID=50419 RepID=UPI003B9BA14E